MAQKGEINLDLKTRTEEFISSKETFVQEERDLLASKMDVKQLPHRLYISFRSREGAVEKLQGIYDEQRRTQEENLMNPNADLWG